MPGFALIDRHRTWSPYSGPQAYNICWQDPMTPTCLSDISLLPVTTISCQLFCLFVLASSCCRLPRSFRIPCPVSVLQQARNPVLRAALAQQQPSSFVCLFRKWTQKRKISLVQQRWTRREASPIHPCLREKQSRMHTGIMECVCIDKTISN